MAKALREWLEEIGQEELPEPEVDVDGKVRTLTLDEKLSRLVWQRALGWVEVVELPGGNESCTVHSPDPKAQAFIFERREGKQPLGNEDMKRPDALDRVRKSSKDDMNDLAQQSLDENNESQSDTPDSVSDE